MDAVNKLAKSERDDEIDRLRQESSQVQAKNTSGILVTDNINVYVLNSAKV